MRIHKNDKLCDAFIIIFSHFFLIWFLIQSFMERKVALRARAHMCV